jgi:hypothetical protein
VADSDANTYGAGSTSGEARRPRSTASVRGAATAASPRRFIMLALRIVSPTGPTSWVSSGAPDTTGSSYPDGPSAIDPTTITVAGRG